MGRTVAYDDHVQKLICELVQVKNSLTVGMVIGQSTQQRDIVVHIANTPKKDDEEPQKEGDGKQSHKSLGVQADIEESWICQHAKQVTRMLPGGMDVLGLFAVGTPEELAAAQPKLRQVGCSQNLFCRLTESTRHI